MSEYVTKDSGERQNFSSGARRDISSGKPRYDLISLPALRRWADLMGRGAEKYGDRNWELGMPLSRFAESGLRHFIQLLEGDQSEDHAAAVLFNVGAMIHFQGSEWDDMNEAPHAEENPAQQELFPTFINSRGEAEYVSVNKRIAALNGIIPPAAEAGAPPKV